MLRDWFDRHEYQYGFEEGAVILRNELKVLKNNNNVNIIINVSTLLNTLI